MPEKRPEPPQQGQPKRGEPGRSAYANTWSYFGFLDSIIKASAREAQQRLAETKKRLRKDA